MCYDVGNSLSWGTAVAADRMTEETNSPIIFISYSHDDDAHRNRVLGLAERLRADGYETHLDQYVNGTSTEGWPRWMLNRLDEATHVLCVCTETYYRRFRGHELPGRGKGGDWEGAWITQQLYDDRSHNTRFIPVFVADADQAHIPDPLRAATHYILTSDAAYQALLDQIDEVAGVEPGPLGVRRPRTRRRARPAEFPNAPGTAPIAAAGLPPIHNIVLPRNPDFTGRQAALEALE